MPRCVWIIGVVMMSLPAEAQYFQMDLMKNRQGKKESNRWTLYEWMSQKQKIGLWDQWLSLNRSANLFELQLSANELDYTLKNENGSVSTEISEKSKLYTMDLWISLVGLRAEYEKRDSGLESKSAMLNLRLVGSSLQSTHLIVRGGVQSLEDTNSGEKWENPFAAANLKLYFLSFIGLYGEYRHFFPKKSNFGRELEGSRVRSGAFLEYGILQVTGSYWREPSEIQNGTEVEKETRDGYDLGVSFTF
jgi:hypothetical protein